MLYDTSTGLKVKVSSCMAALAQHMPLGRQVVLPKQVSKSAGLSLNVLLL